MKKVNHFSQFMLAAATLLASTTLFAKMITLYEQPNDTSKQVGSVDIAKGVVPIFSQTDGKWIKVGDPSNGNVGWIKSSDMSGEAGSSVTFTQRVIDKGNGPQTFQYIQYGPQGNLSNKDAQAMLQQIQMQQQQMQRDAQQLFQRIHNWDMMYSPLFMPVVYVPVPAGTVVTKPGATVPAQTNPNIHPTPRKPSRSIGTGGAGAIVTSPVRNN